MALLNCPECDLPVSSKAISCPHCGYPILAEREGRSNTQTTKQKAHLRLPNGFGQITKINNPNLRKQYRAMVTVGKNEFGKPIQKILKPTGYFKTYNEAYAALVEYNKNPYDFESSITMAELYDKWTDVYFEKLTSNSSVRTVKAAWSHCEPLYTMQVRDVRTRHIKGVIDNDKLSENVKSRIKSVLNLMFDYAVEYEIADKNYARSFNLDVDRSAVKEHITFTEDEMKRLWESTSIPYVNFILLQCYSGWRPKEMLDLKLADVDLDNMTMKGGNKTDAGKNRLVPIHSKIQEICKKIYALSFSLKSEYLLCNPDGTHMTYDMYKSRYAKVIQGLDLNPDHRPHDPRKQFITMAKSNNVNEYAIKRLVGHSIEDITEKIYTERDIKWLRNEIEKIQ